jgi:DNA-binding XRE family transcriptional regulator
LREAATQLQRTQPAEGWIRAFRQALGLSSAALGRRLELAQQSVVQLEENERYARMLAHMVMVRHCKTDPLPWSGSFLRGADEKRKAYIAALVAADRCDFGPLLAFARSR